MAILKVVQGFTQAQATALMGVAPNESLTVTNGKLQHK
jgi:hypothetical protein